LNDLKYYKPFCAVKKNPAQKNQQMRLNLEIKLFSMSKLTSFKNYCDSCIAGSAVPAGKYFGDDEKEIRSCFKDRSA